MKISLKWIKEILPELKVSPKKLADLLTNAGLEVDAIEEPARALENIVVGQVIKKDKHPHADRLSLCTVSDGKQNFQVVCGAPNVRAGKKYPFARLGAKLPNGMEIGPVVIRKVESSGMLCSGKELGISEDQTGILELNDNSKTGQNFSKNFGLDDVILEIGLTPNRGDCLSHWGVAREIAALSELQWKEPIGETPKGFFPISQSLKKVSIQDKKGCSRYCARVIRNVKVGASPQWLQQRLHLLGVRSINNIVDATNYIMLETGHPLHAFDSRFVDGKKITVRKTGETLSFETLDHEKQELTKDDLIIADDKGPIALAGIMGGRDSEIREDTSEVILEAASFDPVRIRQSSSRLNLYTDSSHRFERGIPAETVKWAIDRLASLILEVAGGECSKETIDVFPEKKRAQTIILKAQTLLRILGIEIKKGQVTKILKSLGFEVVVAPDRWKVKVPAFRKFDVVREIDLVEEIIRIKGFDQVPPILPTRQIRNLEENKESFFEKEVHDFFASYGFYETIHYSFEDRSETEKVLGVFEKGLELENPISKEMALMRPSLFPSLLKSFQKNYSKSGLRLYEIRSVYTAPKFEQKRVSGIFSGGRLEEHWQGGSSKMDFYYGKGILESLLDGAKVSNIKWKSSANNFLFHPSESVDIYIDDLLIGSFGKLHPKLTGLFELDEKVFGFDLDYGLLVNKWSQNPNKFKQLSSFPTVERDLALLMDKGLPYSTIIDEINQMKIEFLKNVTLMDFFEGRSLPNDKKSLTFKLLYENASGTLTDEEVNNVHFKMVENLQEKLNVMLR